jgi:aldehyde:ferredoxin oxidoreductase
MGAEIWEPKLLRVDLTTGEARTEMIPLAVARTYIGGRGLNLKLLYDSIVPGIDPVGRKNVLLFGAGPVCGTLVPGGSRITVTAKSPLTGFIGDSSGGGDFSPELRYAGYDVILFEGKAAAPCYLWIDDNRVEVREAKWLWGKTLRETREALRAELRDPDIAVAAIGPAGEHQVAFASVMVGPGRAAGRTGMGAVMGSKNLKAIAVRGTGGVMVADPKGLKKIVQEVNDGHKENANWYDANNTYGSVRKMFQYDELGQLPTYNYRQGTFPGVAGLSPERLRERFIVKDKSCFACPLHCARLFAIPDGPYAGTFGEGPQLSTVNHLGSQLGCDDLDVVMRANALCNDLGLDVIDMAGVISFAMECYERGILTRESTGGVDLPWGNETAIFQLIEETAYRQGFGNILARGSREAAKVIGKGAEDYSMDVKGMTLSSLDPRGQVGWGFGYAVASRGADHTRHLMQSEVNWDPYVAEIFDLKQPLDRFSRTKKVDQLIWHEHLRAVQDSMNVCKFAAYIWMPLLPATMATHLRTVTGLDFDEAEVMETGERIINLERAFNLREGLVKEDDTLPRRFREEPMTEGSAKGRVVDVESLRAEYYEKRDWDVETGWPRKEKLYGLRLDKEAEELQALGKLAVEDAG